MGVSFKQSVYQQHHEKLLFVYAKFFVYANNRSADQLSRTSVQSDQTGLIFHCLNRRIALVSIPRILSLELATEAAQTSFMIRNLKTSLLMMGLIFKPHRKNTGLRGFQPGSIQTSLFSHRRWLEA